MTDGPRAVLTANAPLVSAGAFAGDLSDVGGTVKVLEEAGVSAIHLDIGDGRYSPFTLGDAALVKAVTSTRIKDVHLLVEEPLNHVAAVAAAGADAITVQLDAGRHIMQVLHEIGSHPSAAYPDQPILRGLCLPLEAPVCSLEPFLDELDLVLVLAVVPGHRAVASGTSLRLRVEQVRALLDEREAPVLLSVDGGITIESAEQLGAAGADIVVAGSALFSGGDPRKTFEEMTAALRRGYAPGPRHSGGSKPVSAIGSSAA